MPTLGEIATAIGDALAGGVEVRGDDGVEIHGLAPIDSASRGEITHLSAPSYRRFLAATAASAVLLREADAAASPVTAVVVANPYLAFALVSQLFEDAPQLPPGVDAAAHVAASARVHPSAAVGPHAVVAAGADIGAGVQIGAGAYLGEACRVGAGSVIHPNATLYYRTRIGARCVVHSGAVIGAPGFGFTPDERGRLEAIAQIGGVVLGDEVSVGACSTIDRGTLTDTVVRDGVKIDNQVQIGHNCDIGEHTVICGCVGALPAAPGSGDTACSRGAPVSAAGIPSKSATTCR